MSATDPASENVSAAPQPAASPSFGRFRLQRLLGKSAATLVWLAHDSRTDNEQVLVMTRLQASDRFALDRHLQSARRASRVMHPGLAAPLEVGEHDRWTYVAYARGSTSTLIERMSGQGIPTLDMARWSVQLLDGLAFAHEAGF